MIGEAEKQAVLEVLESGMLSDYLAGWNSKFWGGQQVQLLEMEWAEYFGVKHAVAMNSATSGLYAAMGAIGIRPGDEVIVSPYSMVASATAPLIYGGVPVFADIDEDTFCITAETVERKITSKTKAIIAVDLFGYPIDAQKLINLAIEYNLYVIEDSAQAAGSKLDALYAGTFGDIGIYSLNYHKTIHCGEGGIAVTDDDDLALRLQLIRNHAEACTGDLGKHQDLYGFNFRLTEIQAAIARVQLTKLESLVEQRNQFAEALGKIPQLAECVHPVVGDGIRHGWYLYAVKAPGRQAEVVERLRAQGLQAVAGYVKPIYLEPLFKKYAKPGDCPVAERMHFNELVYIKIP